MYITANDTVSASQAVSTFGRVFTRNSLFPRWRAHTSTQVGYRMWLHCELGVYIITNDGTWHVHTAQHRSSIDGCDEQLAAETSFPRTRQGHATGTVQPTPTHDGTIRPERVRSLQQTDTTDHVKTSTTTIQYVASPQLRAMPPNYAPPHTWALPTWSRQLFHNPTAFRYTCTLHGLCLAAAPVRGAGAVGFHHRSLAQRRSLERDGRSEMG